MLNATSLGEGGTPLLIVPGLFGSARNWRVLQKRFAETRQVIAVDMRNHGDSFWHDDNSYEALAADLGEVIEAYGGRADVLGHSMGGKASMVLALTAPEKLRRLIIADIAPLAYGHTQAGHIEAMKSVDMSVVTRRLEADKQLAKFVTDPALRAFFLGRRWRTVEVQP